MSKHPTKRDPEHGLGSQELLDQARAISEGMRRLNPEKFDPAHASVRKNMRLERSPR